MCCFRTLGDKLGEAKASGNLGNTLKVLGKFDEAIACCVRHLDISKELTDKVSVCIPFLPLGPLGPWVIVIIIICLSTLLVNALSHQCIGGER